MGRAKENAENAATSEQRVLLGLWLDPRIKTELARRAKRQHRSLSALVRLVLEREVG